MVIKKKVLIKAFIYRLELKYTKAMDTNDNLNEFTDKIIFLYFS